MTDRLPPADAPRRWWTHWKVLLFLALVSLTAGGAIIAPDETRGGVFVRIGLLVVLAVTVVTFGCSTCAGSLPRPTP